MKWFKEKKDYVSPQLAVFGLEVQPLLAGSLTSEGATRQNYGTTDAEYWEEKNADKNGYGDGGSYDW